MVVFISTVHSQLKFYSPWLCSDGGQFLGVDYTSYDKNFFFQFVLSSLHYSPGSRIRELLYLVRVPKNSIDLYSGLKSIMLRNVIAYFAYVC